MGQIVKDDGKVDWRVFAIEWVSRQGVSTVLLFVLLGWWLVDKPLDRLTDQMQKTVEAIHLHDSQERKLQRDWYERMLEWNLNGRKPPQYLSSPE